MHERADAEGGGGSERVRVEGYLRLNKIQVKKILHLTKGECKQNCIHSYVGQTVKTTN